MRAELSGKAIGSIIPGVNSTELEKVLLDAQWQPYTHESIMDGCSAFKAPIAGKLGVVELEKLPGKTSVILDDTKSTGKVSATVSFKNISKPKVDFTVLILGLEDGKEVVFTFHPGEPVRPSQVPVGPGRRHGRKVSVSKAIDMGLSIAKLI